jgi:hypothetical protein
MLGRMWFNVTVILILGLLVGWSVCFVDFSYSDRRHEYVQDGDIMLGVLLSVHVYDERRSCGTRVRDKGVVKMAEAIKYEVDRLNVELFAERLHLGFVMLDDCASSDTALGQALRFMPLDRYVSFQNCDTINSGTSESLNKVTHTSSGNLYKVIGVIGPESSPRCLAVANVLGMFGLPQLSPTATSDQLSDKDKYPYFTRLVPPDRGQTLALLSLLLHFGWSHVVTVYSRGAYGESAEEQFTALARQHSICVDLSLAISKSTKHDNAVDVLRRVNGSRARVLVLFADQEEVMLLFTIAFDMDMLRRVVWIGSDGLGMNLYNLRHNVASVAVGSLSFTLAASSAVPARFTAHLSSLSPATTHNPWLLEMLEDFYDCRVTNGTSLSSVDCTPKLKHIIRDWALNFNVSVLSTFIDTVTVLGHAIHSLVQTHCPAVLTSNYSLATLSDCLSSGSRLLNYIRQTEINGLNGHISFDRFGDGIGVYHLINFQRLPNGDQLPVVVGEWDMRTHQLTVNDSLIQWNYAGTVDANGVPLSACGHECAAGEVHSYFRDSCCWQCRKCKPNEITVDNTTHCFACPFYTWPDSNVTECVPLTAQVVSWQHPAIVTVLGLGVLGLVYCTVVFTAYVSHWQARLIKATSRELSFLMLGGVALQYALVWCVCAQPSQFTCSAKYAGFNVSFTLVYATLLVRTNRIYRIFRAGQRTRRLPMCSSPATQVLIVGMLTFVQVSQQMKHIQPIIAAYSS